MSRTSRPPGPPRPALPDATGAATPALGSNAGLPVFRVRRSRGLLYAVTLPLVASVPSAVLLARASRIVVAGVLAAAAVLGALLGWLTARDTCSEPSCGVPLPRGRSACPGCGGQVRGVISSPAQREAAERRLARRARRRRGRGVDALEAARELVGRAGGPDGD